MLGSYATHVIPTLAKINLYLIKEGDYSTPIKPTTFIGTEDNAASKK